MELAVKLLLEKAKALSASSKIKRDELERQAVQEYFEEMREVKSFIEAAQNLCDHSKYPERKEDDYDYHKREDWTIYYCTCCDKQLRRM